MKRAHRCRIDCDAACDADLQLAAVGGREDDDAGRGPVDGLVIILQRNIVDIAAAKRNRAAHAGRVDRLDLSRREVRDRRQSVSSGRPGSAHEAALADGTLGDGVARTDPAAQG